MLVLLLLLLLLLYYLTEWLKLFLDYKIDWKKSYVLEKGKLFRKEKKLNRIQKGERIVRKDRRMSILKEELLKSEKKEKLRFITQCFQDDETFLRNASGRIAHKTVSLKIYFICGDKSKDIRKSFQCFDELMNFFQKKERPAIIRSQCVLSIMSVRYELCSNQN